MYFQEKDDDNATRFDGPDMGGAACTNICTKSSHWGALSVEDANLRYTEVSATMCPSGVLQNKNRRSYAIISSSKTATAPSWLGEM